MRRLLALVVLVAVAGCGGGTASAPAAAPAADTLIVGTWMATRPGPQGDEPLARLVIGGGVVRKAEFTEGNLVQVVDGVRHYREVVLRLTVLGSERDRVLADIAGGADVWRFEAVHAGGFRLGPLVFARSDGALPPGVALDVQPVRGAPAGR